MISLKRSRELFVRSVRPPSLLHIRSFGYLPSLPFLFAYPDSSAHRHLHFVGPGLVSSVAYIDPGNWATDLQAGALYGYKLLFIVLLSGLAAVGTYDSLPSTGFASTKQD